MTIQNIKVSKRLLQLNLKINYNYYKMEVTLTPDTYTPNIDNNNYVDTLTFPFPQGGLKCGCGSNTVFSCLTKFKAHTHTKKHKKWLEDLTKNNGNYYVELKKSEKTVKEQQKIIADMDKRVIELEAVNRFLRTESFSSMMVLD